MNAIWREETIFDSLPQTVLVNRIAEVEIRVARFIAQRCRGHPELIGRLEVFQDFAPVDSSRALPR